MTYLEKYRLENPDRKLWADSIIYSLKCPEPGRSEYCANLECDKCWNQEVPEETDIEKRISEMEEKLDEFEEEDSIEGKFTIATPSIKDSGDRTEFSTGAVRDMRVGKGRCDLIPLDAASEILDDSTLYLIGMFQEDGNSNHLVSALKSCGFYEDPYTMLLEVAKHFEDGAKKYGTNNWQKGIPVWCYIDSAVRHYLKHMRGDKDEPHDRAFVWNILCAMWTLEHKPEMKEGK